MISPAPAAGPILRADGVSLRIGSAALIDGVSLSFAAGEHVAIVGPNGAGKTTLLRLLAGVREPTAGTVTLDGIPVTGLPRAALARRMAYVPQNTWTDFDVTVGEAVAMGRYAYAGPWRPLAPEDRRSVAEALERVELTGMVERTLPTLSGGERQRVFLARALAPGSSILVLDEPTAALDVAHQLELMDLLRGLHAQGKTVIAAMHDLRLALEYFPRAVLLDHGRKSADGPCREVLAGEAAKAAMGVEIRIVGEDGGPEAPRIEYRRAGGQAG